MADDDTTGEETSATTEPPSTEPVEDRAPDTTAAAKTTDAKKKADKEKRSSKKKVTTKQAPAATPSSSAPPAREPEPTPAVAELTSPSPERPAGVASEPSMTMSASEPSDPGGGISGILALWGPLIIIGFLVVVLNTEHRRPAAQATAAPGTPAIGSGTVSLSSQPTPVGPRAPASSATRSTTAEDLAAAFRAASMPSGSSAPADVSGDAPPPPPPAPSPAMENPWAPVMPTPGHVEGWPPEATTLPPGAETAPPPSAQASPSVPPGAASQQSPRYVRCPPPYSYYWCIPANAGPDYPPPPGY